MITDRGVSAETRGLYADAGRAEGGQICERIWRAMVLKGPCAVEMSMYIVRALV